ncbi:MAG: hypothetical protein EON95_11355 [Caulobacteraceae bacterium]|nr:MAG: hypothetical protein EON95_11355 [Caulobacteraceae bacterium]
MTRRSLIALTVAGLLIGPTALPLATPAHAGNFQCQATAGNVEMMGEAERLALAQNPQGAPFSHDAATWTAYMDRGRWVRARGACQGNPALATVSAQAARQKLAAVIAADRSACTALGNKIAWESRVLSEAAKSEPLDEGAIFALQGLHEVDQDYIALCPGDPGLAGADAALLGYDATVRRIAAAGPPADEAVMPMLSAVGPQTSGLVCRVTLNAKLPGLKSQQAALGAQDKAACATARPAAQAILAACESNPSVMGKLGPSLQKVDAFCGG